MRILYLASDRGLSINASGGAGTHMRGTIDGFQKRGHKVLSLIGGDCATVDKRCKRSNSNLYRRKAIRQALPNSVRLLLRDLRYILHDFRLRMSISQSVIDFRPDVIYERSSYLMSTGSYLARKYRVPHFLETSGCLVEVFGSSFGTFDSRFANKFEKLKLSRADRVVVEARSAIGFVAHKFDLCESKVIAKPLGVDPGAFTVNDTLLAEIVRRYGLSDKIVIGFIGTFSPYQGLPLLLKAAQSLVGFDKIIFLIVGWGQNGPEYKHLATQLGLSNVHFAGMVDRSEVASYIQAFDVGLVPDCEHHMYPIKAIEYGLGGACPVVPDYEAFEDMIYPARNGIKFRPGQPESLAQELAGLISSRSLINRLGSNWRTDVLSNFSWESTVEPVLSAMSDFVKGGSCRTAFPTCFP